METNTFWLFCTITSCSSPLRGEVACGNCVSLMP
uniref:Uncharacterized protein n=1 Tax=virus sp. ctPYc18 TaxID=2828251 RepID=A0A8S5RD83_9VIRU|nr:MAG TPA: hypothetical protein [virus sp. ctPYc18]